MRNYCQYTVDAIRFHFKILQERKKIAGNLCETILKHNKTALQTPLIFVVSLVCVCVLYTSESGGLNACEHLEFDIYK